MDNSKGQIIGHYEPLPIEIRQKVYSFILSIYEAFEALTARGVLVNDIESSANRVLGLVAHYGVTDIKDKLIKDILGELKQLKAFLGIARDISLLERHPAAELLMRCTSLESIFFDVLGTVKTEAVQPAEISLGISGIGPNVVDEAEPIGDPEMNGASGANHEAAKARTIARREAIMEVLKHRARVSVRDLSNLFMGRVSLKMLQRDLQEMVEAKIVKKEGDKRWAYYSLA